MKHFKPRNKRHQEAGFSIVEAAVAVAIAGILTSAALPTFKKALVKAKLAEAQNQVSALVVQSHSKWLETEDPSAVVAACVGEAVEIGSPKWSYTCLSSDGVTLTVAATATTYDYALAGATVTGTLNLPIGTRNMVMVLPAT